MTKRLNLKFAYHADYSTINAIQWKNYFFEEIDIDITFTTSVEAQKVYLEKKACSSYTEKTIKTTIVNELRNRNYELKALTVHGTQITSHQQCYFQSYSGNLDLLKNIGATWSSKSNIIQLSYQIIIKDRPPY